MKIVLTGGGSGGHFYPLISVAEAIEDICAQRILIEPELVYMGPPPFDMNALLEHDIEYKPSAAGRMRTYGSILNVFSIFGIIRGVIRTTIQLFNMYPDVVFSTGGFAAFPTLFAARLLRIPVMIYDADATPIAWGCSRRRSPRVRRIQTTSSSRAVCSRTIARRRSWPACPRACRCNPRSPHRSR